ncbi:hypothetical protein [Mycolicibacterium tusciae]|uniref:hypothetical protein n=1 Tax=Mycolicibacterium tusciae TaxID=75922 RepID=UPI00024A3A91|nr:hypothetical protein [Mycolicibacterium tusciae]
MNGFLAEIAEEFQIRIIDEGKLGAFAVLTSFLLTFAAVRGLAHAVRRQLRCVRNIEIADVHVHHLVPGIGLLCLPGTWRSRSTTAIIRCWPRYSESGRR